MPKSVKTFVALGVLYVLFGGALLAWTVFYTPPAEAHLLARLPAAMRAELHQAMWQSGLIAFALHSAIFLVLGGFAAFGRQNWARWGLLIYFALVLAGSFMIALRSYLFHPAIFLSLHHGVAGWWTEYVTLHWLTPRVDWPVYLGTALKLALIVLIFSPNARPWFRAPSPE